MKMPRKLVASEALNTVVRNSRRSIIGSARRSWRRAKATPTANPTSTASTASGPTPSWAICFSPTTTASTATRDMTALARSSRPAAGSRYSGSTRGPSTSSRAITGRASRNTEPHQNRSSSTPPATGPIAPPAENAAIHTPDGLGALLGVGEHREDQRQRRRCQGRPGDAQQRPSRDQLPGAGRQGGQDRHHPEGGGPGQQQSAAADPVAQGAHGDQEPGDHEPVDVGDPQQLGAAGLQLGAERRHGQVRHRQVHGVQHTGQGEHRQPDPLAPARPWDVSDGHLSPLPGRCGCGGTGWWGRSGP